MIETMEDKMDLFATIKKRSKYYDQQYFAGEKPVPFQVVLDFNQDPKWPVKGGFGGQYTLYDVDLWFKRSGEFLRIPMHIKPKY